MTLSVDVKNSLEEATALSVSVHRLDDPDTSTRVAAPTSHPDCDESWNEGFYGNGRPRKSVGRRSMSAARWVYMQHHGLTSDQLAGLVVRHTCDNGRCVNPQHLIVGTQADNVKDSIDRGRHSAGERHGCAKVTESIVREIRATYIKGTSRWNPGNGQELRSRFGLSRTQISDIVNRKKWSHVV